MRLIDADALGVGRCSSDVLPVDYCTGWNGLINIIENAPTIDAVPVVRLATDNAPCIKTVMIVFCKDCKYRRKNDENEPYCTAKDGLSDPWDDEFCSYGERK